MTTVLDQFSPAVRAWFEGAFAAPTAAQLGAWEAIMRGDSTLVVAPTGSGKTLAAFLWALDRLTTPPSGPGAPQAASASTVRSAGRSKTKILYVSPLKALAVDVARNLRAPLTGIRQAAARMGQPEPVVEVAMRTGDTPADQRRKLLSRPPDILITTPESLFLILTSRARDALTGVATVIVDEVHAVAGTKRGAHLALSLERLDALLEAPAQRIGLSATVRPTDEVARFLGGRRPVTVVQPPAAKTIELDVVVPVPDLGELGGGPAIGETGAAGTVDEPGGLGDGPELPPEPTPGASSIWPHVEERIVDLIAAHRSTIVFANSRRLAERLTARLNEIAYERAAEADDVPLAPSGVPTAEIMAQAGVTRGAPSVLARAHHGSVSKEQRAVIEEELKAGRLPAVVATSSLELGIDMGAVDLVVQVESPPSVASGLQRVGRAGHQVGAVSKGVVFPKYRGDLVQTAVVAERMVAGQIESLRVPHNPLDVLAQHVVSATSMDDWDVDELFELAQRAAPFAQLPRSAYEAVLDMLAGRYPSDEFAELRPRIVWDRVAGTLHGRPGAQRLAVTSGGTIPDRGLFGVFLVGEGTSRVGELDEEMVYESRVGDVFTLGTTSWRIEDITHDRVLVSPAPGLPGKLPFWKGDAPGRPAELGRAVGAFVRELAGLDETAARARARQSGLDEWAVDNLLGYLAEQREATGHVPTDRTILVERFRDELGDWRVAVHSPFGAQVHAPWALAIAARLRESYGVDVQVMHADDGIVLRLPDTDAALLDSGASAGPPPALAVFDPDEIESLVTAEVGGSALFAARFRECAARALLLPRRDPKRRTPLWQQRQRSAQLLGVASQYGSFPIVLETMRECLQDVFDVPGLVGLMRDLRSRAVRVIEVETPSPSPFARSLLFGYVAAFLYEGDAPLVERRAAALTLDATLLAELLGQAELRELLDPAAIEQVESELQRLVPDRAARDIEGAADLLRMLGPLNTTEAQARGADPGWLVELEVARRAIRVRLAGAEHWVAIEDAGRLRDALGVPLPVGVPEAFLEPVRDPLGDLIARFARTHGPFHAGDVAVRFGLGVAVVTETLRRLATDGRVIEGAFRPGGSGTEWSDAAVLRRIRRLSIAALRKEAEPVPPVSLARFLPAWQHVGVGARGAALRGLDGVVRAIEQLQGAPVPASALERLILPARVTDYSPGMLDELTAAGEVFWSGQGVLPGKDGWIALYLAETAPLLLAPPDPLAELTPLHEQIRSALADGHALFFRALADRIGSLDDQALATAMWDLVWAGQVSNDSMAPVRALLGAGKGAHRSRPSTPRARYSRAGRYPSLGPSALGQPTLGQPALGRPALPSRGGPPTMAGRWWLLPAPETDPTRRAQALTETLLDRHGVLTRGAVIGERPVGGFAPVYKVLRAYEDAGRARRGYFVEGLGGAQFALPGAVDRLRALAEPRDNGSRALVLAATDPANPYGAALPWPDRPGEVASGHKPGRKAGAIVVLVDGELVLYVERGGRTLLTWSEELPALQPAVDALALAVRDGALGKLTVERADGAQVLTSPLGRVLETAGFHATPRGLRLRG
ncbi:MAG: ATP-dependent helicase [Sporichthyaceae bacterium]|nr:ATP-dependent helicase [Sporichthyaceae bacterium]